MVPEETRLDDDDDDDDEIPVKINRCLFEVKA